MDVRGLGRSKLTVSFWTVGIATKIRSGHLQNTIRKIARYNNLKIS